MSLQRGEQQRARWRQDHIPVCERVVVLGRKPGTLRLNSVKRSSTYLCLIECHPWLVRLLCFPFTSLQQLVYGDLKGSWVVDLDICFPGRCGENRAIESQREFPAQSARQVVANVQAEL